jgi:hypothetical protein
MKSESILPPSLEEQIHLMKKQLKRISEFSRFLPFADQQRELDALVNRLNIEVMHLHRSLTFFASVSDNTPEGWARVAEKFLAQTGMTIHESE